METFDRTDGGITRTARPFGPTSALRAAVIPLTCTFAGIGVIVDRATGARRELLTAPIPRAPGSNPAGRAR
jgi:hypothetical protein